MDNLAYYLLNRSNKEDTLYHFKSESLSRHQFESMVRRLASQFQACLGPGDHAVIAVNDSPLLSASFLALIAIGAVPTAINPRLNARQIRHICKDCAASMLVVETSRASELSTPFLVEHLLCTQKTESSTHPLKDLPSMISNGDPEWSDFHEALPERACYLQYTSGSTGACKGVVHTIENTRGFCQAFAVDHLNIDRKDTLYSVPKMFFGYGMGNSLFFPLYTGASAVLDDEWPTPQSVVANIARYKPTVFFSVPSMYQALRDSTGIIANTIRLAFSAGSQLPAAEFEFWRRNGVEVCDGIGATEVGHVFLAHTPGQARPNSTGKPVAGYQCKLVDERGRVVDTAGRLGVLLVKGPGVARRYWNLVDRTEQRFVDGWYRTGDLFQMDEDGFFQYSGREDDKFKVKGRWVLPMMIEKAVCDKFPLVQEAALVPSTRDHDAVKPTLFITLRSTADIALERQIESWASGQIEPYAYPRKIIRLEALPRNANGKLDRASLTQRAHSILHGEA